MCTSCFRKYDRNYEVEIEESEKGGSRWESNQGHLACTIGLSTSLYFRLVKSKFQHEARALSNYNYVCFTAAEIIKKADRPNIKIEFVSAHYVYGLLLQEENFSFPIQSHISKKKFLVPYNRIHITHREWMEIFVIS